MKPPTPIPKTTRPTEKHPRDPWGCVITDGNAEIIKMIWPKNAKTIESWIVLSRPRNSSPIQAPTSGVT